MASVIEQSYIDIYRNFKEKLCAKSSLVLNHSREESFRQFEQFGFQTKHSESYKYTDFATPFNVNYGMNLNRASIDVSDKDLIRCDVSGLNTYLFFVVNDTFYCTEERRGDLESLCKLGVFVGSLQEYARTHPEIVEKYYNKISHREDSYASFNTIFAQDGFFLYVPKGVHVDKPIQIIFVTHASSPLLSNPRNLIILDDEAKAQVLICAHSLDDVEMLSNRVTEVWVGENATYDHYKLENTNSKSQSIGSLYIKQRKGSNVLVNDITLHNGLTRNNVTIDLEEEHCETLLCGMAVEDSIEHVDNSTTINHKAPHCKSNELYKYVLNDSSVGVFSGKIHVACGAQKTEAYQINRNVCMTPEAQMYTKPQLEIYADDVKCSHGASTGRVDDNALFYLRSRGIPEEEAKLLLMYAFVNDVIENIRIEALKDKIKSLVEKRFRGELSHCSNCGVCR